MSTPAKAKGNMERALVGKANPTATETAQSAIYLAAVAMTAKHQPRSGL